MSDSTISETHILPSGILLAVLSTLALFLDIPPLIWHIRNRNTSAIILVLWILLLNFLNILNIVLWPYISYPKVWLGTGLCDIEVKLLVAKLTGVPAAILCLVKTLARVLDTEKTLLGPTKAQKRRQLYVELAWCVGFPVATMVAHYLFQYNRYILFGLTGCVPTYVRNWPAFLLIPLPPLLLNIAAGYYSCLVLIRLRKYRHSFHTILASSATTSSRFLRLFAIAILLLLGSIPVQLYVLYLNLPLRGQPISFTEIHDKEVWDTVLVGGSKILYDRWISVACGICVFVLFGVGKDALGMYRGWIYRLGLGGLVLRVDDGSSMRGILGDKGSGWSRSGDQTLASVDERRKSFRDGETADSILRFLPSSPLETVLRRMDPRAQAHTHTSQSEDQRLEMGVYHTPKHESEGVNAEIWSQVSLDEDNLQEHKPGSMTVRKDIRRQSSGF